MKNKLTILMLLISFAAIGQEGYNPYAIFGTTDTFDIEAAHKAKAEKEKQEKENLFYLFNADTTATMQILAFDFVNGKVYAYNANEELLGTLYYFEYGDAAFISTDPKWYAFPHLTPYNYCANNPIMMIDPGGDSTAMLNMGNGLNQHTAMLVQNEQGKWQYYSVNGDNIYFSGDFSSGSFTGGRPFNESAVGEWNSPQEFLDSDFNTRATGVEKYTNTNINGYGF